MRLEVSFIFMNDIDVLPTPALQAHLSDSVLHGTWPLICPVVTLLDTRSSSMRNKGAPAPIYPPLTIHMGNEGWEVKRGIVAPCGDHCLPKALTAGDSRVPVGIQCTFLIPCISQSTRTDYTLEKERETVPFFTGPRTR